VDWGVNMYDYLLFDWDGCIVDNVAIWTDVCQKVLAMHGVNPTRDEIWSGICTGDVSTVFKVEDTTLCRKRIGDVAYELFGSVDLYPGAQETLKLLRRHARLAIVSNTHPELLDRVMQNHPGLAENFDLIITRENVHNVKPHPEGIMQALFFFDADPGRTLMIGDSEKDLQAAQKAGVDSVLLHPPSHHDLYDLSDVMKYGLTYVISGHEELIAIQGGV